ncbi:MAG: putative hemolysin [Anaerolineae bacterium]
MIKILAYIVLLVALTACTSFQAQAPDTGTEVPQAGIPNPASVYCTQQGNKLEIRTADDGSQQGICVFPDGSTCDEWAYYRGECGPAAQSSPTPTQAVEAATPAGGGAEEDASGGSKPPESAEEVVNWWGYIRDMAPGAEFDDYFERYDLGQVIYFGIDSLDPAVKAQIEELRDSGKIVHLYGTLLSNVPDYNGSQVQVDRIEVEG